MSSYPPTGTPSPDGTASTYDSTPVFEEARAETTQSEALGALYTPQDADSLDTENDTQNDTDGASAENASDTKDAAKDAAQGAATVTKDQAKEVVSEVKSQSRQLLSQAGSELRDQAQTQQQRVAEGLHGLSEQFDGMAAGGDSSGVAHELVTALSQRSGAVASWLEERDPGSLLEEVKSFAARRPGAFIAIAAGVGIAAGRLGKSLAASARDESSEI